jgi:hypothetical protein
MRNAEDDRSKQGKDHRRAEMIELQCHNSPTERPILADG